MPGRWLVHTVFAGAAFTGALTVGLRGPADEPVPPFNPGIAELFDPLALARNMCGRAPGANGINPLLQFAAAAIPEPAAAPELPPHLWDGLGARSYPITTASKEAQAYFDQGLLLSYSFNPGESVASFRAARTADPACAMCFWGEAFAHGAGPFGDDKISQAIAAIAKAKEFAGGATPREQALIEALAQRYSADKTAKRKDLDGAFAAAMEKAAAAYPDDLEIAMLAATSIMYGTRERSWEKDGTPTPEMKRTLEIIESVLARDPDHPGAIHIYIHAMDGSPTPEKSEPYADKLGRLVPGAGHMVHMPAHTFFNRGRYIDALKSNVAAIAVDDVYLAAPSSAAAGYRYGLYFHNMHFAIAAADMAGDGAAALDMARRMTKAMADQGEHVFSREYYGAAPIHPVVDFGTPDDVLALPEPDRSHAYVRGIWHYARGTAYARLGDKRRALAEAAAIAKLRARGNKRAFANSFPDYVNAAAALGIAERVVRARVAAESGDWSAAVRHLEKAVAFNEELKGKDPPLWDFPARQALGVALMHAGKTKEAVDALRAALLDAPNSGYALYALKQALVTSGDQTGASAYGQLYEKAWSGPQAPDLNRL